MPSIDAFVSVDGAGAVASLDVPVAAPAATEFRDFATARKSGIVLPSKVDGKGVLIWRMVPKTSTHAADVPAQSTGKTNPLYLAWVGPAGGALVLGIDIGGGWLLQGTDQGHLYGGLMVAYANAPHVHDGYITGIPGDNGAPPGETFSLNLWKCTDALVENVGIDGQGISASPFGLNSVTGAIVRGCLAKNNRAGIGFTSWQSSAVQVIGTDLRKCVRPFNIERPAGDHFITEVDFRDSTSTKPQVTCNTDGHAAKEAPGVYPDSVKVEIHDPIWDFTKGPFRVGVVQKTATVSGDYRPGYPNTQKPSDVSLWIAGKNVSGDKTKLAVGNVY